MTSVRLKDKAVSECEFRMTSGEPVTYETIFNYEVSQTIIDQSSASILCCMHTVLLNNWSIFPIGMHALRVRTVFPISADPDIMSSDDL